MRGVERPPLVRPPLVRPPLVWRRVVDSWIELRRRVTLGALIAATAVAAIVLWQEVVRDLRRTRPACAIPWWALAAGFAFTELFVIHAHVRGSAHSLSLSEVPLVLGLLLADPQELVLAMVVGPAIVLLRHARPGLVRLVFNLAQFGLTAVVATITLHGWRRRRRRRAGVWARDFAAVFACSLTGAVLVFCAIGLSEGGIPSRGRGMLGADLVVALTNTSVALSGATVVAEDLRAGWLLIRRPACCWLAYRAYVSERAKHQSLEFLYGVTRSLSRGRELEPSCSTCCAGRARASACGRPSSCCSPPTAGCARRAGRTGVRR